MQKMKVIEYVFEKKNGDIRIMKGTTSFKAFAKQFPQRWNHIKPVSDLDAIQPKKSVITMIDLESKEWRSIRPESIISQREVKTYKPTFHFGDSDGYFKNEFKIIPNSLQKNKVPYHVLMLLNSQKDYVGRSFIEENLDTILAKQGTNRRIRGRRLRCVSRALRLFRRNGFIVALRDAQQYKITDKGRKLITTSVK